MIDQDHRRWLITGGFLAAIPLAVSGSHVPEGESVEAMPVTAHNAEMVKVAVELGKDIIRAEAALAAARQVDEAMVELAAQALYETPAYGCEPRAGSWLSDAPGHCEYDRDQWRLRARAALLAARTPRAGGEAMTRSEAASTEPARPQSAAVPLSGNVQG